MSESSGSYKFLSSTAIRSSISEAGGAILKKLSQNFLTDPNHIRITAKKVLENTDDPLLEIGPGLGALTGALLESGRRIISVEIDPVLSKILRGEIGDRENFLLIEGDARIVLKRDSVEYSEILQKVHSVCGNLPYYITTELLTLTAENRRFHRAVFLTQMEFAARLLQADPSSSIHIYLHNFGRWRSLHKIPAGAFYPAPSVDSTLIGYEANSQGPLCRPELLEGLLRMSFLGKRKKISNSWKLDRRNLIPLDTLIQTAGELGFSMERRPQEIHRDEYYSLVRSLEKSLSRG